MVIRWWLYYFYYILYVPKLALHILYYLKAPYSSNIDIFIQKWFNKLICSIISFVCHYWQWPILINCVMCYYLCVLRWLMRPILALNCLLQTEQEISEEESSVGDALALAFRCARFCSASLILFCFVFTSSPSYEALSLCSILCNLFPWLCWYVKVFKGGFDGVLVSLLLTSKGTCFNL